MRALSALLFFLPIISACNGSTPSLALGTLERDRVILTATANQIVRSTPIAEGSPVHQGDILVVLDDKQQKAIVARARAEVAKASAYLLRLTNGERPEDIAAAQANLHRVEATLVEAQANYHRAVTLVDRKLASQAELDSARANRDAAIAERESAREQLAKLTRGSRVEDITQARASLEAAQAEQALQQQILSDLTVVATRDGILDSLPYNVGERVPKNGVVAAIQAEMAPFARVYVPEPYRVAMTPGMPLTVHVDGVATSFQGRLRWIATEPSFTPYFALNEQDRARLVYLAEVLLPESAMRLPSGVPAQVEMPRE
ncbi:HlyD family efflux transporter periplasmic adaptor subunit [Ferrimonas sediminicola]|uniref:HlyD family efflux transporter periplasmic adaptor subunit n=1 Tax=Ferrimonas sediminicola TaxID=2569538 RepID=A0A4U1BDV0_9GAMM|nr:HlyD family efflux transporter periplasmic adaptor subunit [Ferrimonas sediminicola]TKB48958.1 HlyD family efflux transporter periplasmic adaptor subunit [Ferrimonas sediminicola]